MTDEITMPADERAFLRGPERRTFNARMVDMEFRGAGDGNGFILTGHAAVFDQATELYAGKGYRIVEDIAPDAFNSVLAANPDVHLNVNHDMSKPMARTGRSASQMGGLELSTDAQGLRVFARVNPDISYVRDLSIAMRDGVVDQMSFAFTIDSEQLTTTTDANGMETDHFRILSVGQLYDVCICAQGAYPQTDVTLHSRMAAAGRISPEMGRTGDVAASGPGEAASIAPPAGADLAAARQLRALQLKARAALMNLEKTR